jgi:magnesium-protoporphyrin IX monomethyl ester (oxidative) cyclase
MAEVALPIVETPPASPAPTHTPTGSPFKRVLFITTPWQSSKENSSFANQIAFPLGIAYLAAIARKRGCEIKVVDSLVKDWKNSREEGNSVVRGLTWEAIEKEISDFSPDVVAIGGPFSSQANMVHRMAATVKKVNPKAITLVGGGYASAEPQKAVKDLNINYIFKGEAEKTFDSFLSGEDPAKIPGLIYEKNGEVIFTGEANKFTQLDEIPFPAYDVMGLENYFKANEDGAVIRGKMTDKTVSIITSRGCPHFCNFCSIYQVWGRQWRFRSPKNVVDEIEMLLKQYGVQHILFEDDNMTINMARFELICDEIISRGLKFSWETPNGIRGDRVTLQLAKKMKAAGCKRVRIAIENGDQHTLDKIIRKDLDLNKALLGIRACLDAKLLVDCFFIFGIPGETTETFRKTHDFALTVLHMGANPLCSIAVPLPNTALYDECVEKGYLIENVDWSQVMSARIKPIIRTKEFGPQDVIHWYNKTQRDIALTIATHPWYFFRTNMGSEMISNPSKVLSGFRKMYNGTIKPYLASTAHRLGLTANAK